MIEIDLKKINQGNNPLDELLKNMFGLSKKKDEETKLEAPLSKELNFNLDKEYDSLPFEVKDLDGLIALADLYDKDKPHMFGFNMKRLSTIRESLLKLNDVIGMKNVNAPDISKV